MIVVAIIGVLAALAIYGVRKYLATSKTAEAKNTIGTMARAAQAAYERETTASQLVDDGALSNASSHALCLSAAKAVPDGPPPAGTKYQPSTAPGVDFDAGNPLVGWQCLKFLITVPIYYKYYYVIGPGVGVAAGGPNPGADGFEAAAQGDLDGNGVYSTFSRPGSIVNGQVKVATHVYINNEFE